MCFHVDEAAYHVTVLFVDAFVVVLETIELCPEETDRYITFLLPHLSPQLLLPQCAYFTETFSSKVATFSKVELHQIIAVEQQSPEGRG